MSSSSSLEPSPRSPRKPARDLALIAMFAGITAVLGAVPAWAPFGFAVPITAQSLGPMLAGSIIGARRGLASMLLFLVLVAAGLPLLAGGRGGIAVFAGPSVGFLVAFPPVAWVIGAITARVLPRYRIPAGLAANLVGGIGLMYLLGVPGMAWRADLSLGTALLANAVFVPGDLVKAIIATVVAKGVHLSYPRFADEARRQRDLRAGRR